MELFNKFRTTIFLKNDNNLEKQLLRLKQIREKLISTNQIDKEIKFLELGIKGEKRLEFELKNANLGMFVLNDITIKHEDLKAQIDYIIVTKGYIYLVECKNLIGNIKVNSQGEFQRNYVLNGKKITEAIYSPYTQAIRHKEIIKKKWLNNNNKLVTFIREKSFDNYWYKPLVVICNSNSILEMKEAPKEIKNSVIKIDNLVEYIKKDLDNYDKDLLMNKKTMEEIANKFLELNTNEYNDFSSKYEDTLYITEKLKEYRKNKAKEKNIPAYYVFTNEELENIIKNKPKTFDDLKRLAILSDIKLKLYGKEIIEILDKKS